MLCKQLCLWRHVMSHWHSNSSVTYTQMTRLAPSNASNVSNVSVRVTNSHNSAGQYNMEDVFSVTGHCKLHNSTQIVMVSLQIIMWTWIFSLCWVKKLAKKLYINHMSILYHPQYVTDIGLKNCFTTSQWVHSMNISLDLWTRKTFFFGVRDIIWSHTDTAVLLYCTYT